MRFCIIDVGSNSVRLLLGQDGTVLYKRVETTRLGEGIAFSHKLKGEAIERTVSAIARFLDEAKSVGTNETFAFATAAVRSAENKDEFLSAVEKRCGLKVEVVSGEEEARLGIDGALGTGVDGGVIDVGGASTEIAIRKDGKICYQKSVDIGVVRLKDLSGGDPSEMREKAKNVIQTFGKVPTDVDFYGVGGTATTLASLKIGKDVYDGALVSKTVLTRAELTAWRVRLCALSVDEIKRLKGIDVKRADVIAGGAVILEELLSYLGVDELHVSDRDNLEGYAKKKGLL